MSYQNNVTQKDIEDASLFKEFIRVIHTPQTAQLNKKERICDLNTNELNAERLCRVMLRFKGDSPVNLNRDRSLGNHENRDCTPYKNASPDNESNCSSFNSRGSSELNSEYQQGFGGPKPPFVHSERRDYSMHNVRVPKSCFSEDKTTFKNEPFQFTETDQGFICAYCESKYIYKRCLINHLLKSHRKLIKNPKFIANYDL